MNQNQTNNANVSTQNVSSVTNSYPSLMNNSALVAAIANAQTNKNQAQGNVTASRIIPKSPPGRYIAVLTNAKLELNQSGKFGINDKIKATFTVIIPNHTPESVEISADFWKSDSKNSAYYRSLSKLLGKDPRQGFSLQDLIGTPCEVDIVHNPVGNGAYANIADVTKINLNTPKTTNSTGGM